MDFNEFIYKTETIGKVESSEVFHAAFGVDANFVPPMGIMLTSMLINNPEYNLHVHVFLDSILNEDLDKLNKLAAENSNIQIDLHYLNAQVFQNFQVSKGYPLAIYYRIMAADILYPAVSSLLYLDADTLCVGSLTELKKLSFDNKMLMAVLDRGSWLQQHKQEIGIPKGQDYFNSGVLYINLKKWNQFEMSDKMMKLLNEKKLTFPDQDALNLIAGNQIKPIPVKFNQFLLMKENNNELPADTVFIHFAGQVKPWQPWCDNPQRAIYDEYRNKSLWREFEYHPRDYQENRLMGKAAYRKGQILTMLKWYYKYVKDKLT